MKWLVEYYCYIYFLTVVAECRTIFWIGFFSHYSLYYNKILFYLDFFFTDIDLNKGSDENFVQEYIANPFLVDQRKFDIGIYTVLTSIDPLRVYVYDQEVLIRYSHSTKCYQKLIT